MREFGDSHKRGALHMNKIRGSTHWGEDIERKPTCAAVDEVSPPRPAPARQPAARRGARGLERGRWPILESRSRGLALPEQVTERLSPLYPSSKSIQRPAPFNTQTTEPADIKLAWSLKLSVENERCQADIVLAGV
jgi:hypothetical protein